MMFGGSIEKRFVYPTQCNYDKYMRIEYDSAKNQQNLEKHSVSFEEAFYFEFDTAFAEIDRCKDYGEQLIRAIGYIGQRLYHLTDTKRGEFLRIISLRKANPRELKHYAKA